MTINNPDSVVPAAANAGPRKTQSAIPFVLWASSASFCAYFAMYAFRKPFAAASFSDVPDWMFGLDYKSALVIAQVFGYALSKVAGIRIIAEMGARGRGAAIVGLIALAWLALIGFALIPQPYNVAMLFLNGIPLGLIWGLVFSYLEGRRTSEVLGAILCSSFIVSSGAVKSVATWLMTQWDVSAFWMPAATGALFFPLLLVSVVALSRLPPPNADDVAERTARAPMNAQARRAFIATHGAGLAMLVLGYVLFTAFRDLRDNFSTEIWAALGFKDVASVFTLSELPVAVCALAALALFMFIRNNRMAFLAMHGVIGLGALVIGLSTLAFQAQLIGPMAWMIASGAGLYLAYTPFNAMLFDRLIAAARTIGTAGFLIYIADASGYLGSIALLLVRNFGAPDLDWLPFFTSVALATSVIGVTLTAGSAILFARRLPKALATDAR